MAEHDWLAWCSVDQTSHRWLTELEELCWLFDRVKIDCLFSWWMMLKDKMFYKTLTLEDVPHHWDQRPLYILHCCYGSWCHLPPQLTINHSQLPKLPPTTFSIFNCPCSEWSCHCNCLVVHSLCLISHHNQFIPHGVLHISHCTHLPHG